MGGYVHTVITHYKHEVTMEFLIFTIWCAFSTIMLTIVTQIKEIALISNHKIKSYLVIL